MIFFYLWDRFLLNFTNKKIFLNILITLIVVSGWSCSSRQTDRSPHIEKADTYFQNRRFAQALDVIRPRTLNSQERDRLLYLMEAGSILHTMQEWRKSTLVFKEANELSENIQLSRGKEILAFFINQKEQNFIGENFERVKIKLYIALNYLMMGKRKKAFIFFRNLNQELADIRFEGSNYKQNFAARYLGAILAEEQKDYNYARVQYNNMLAAGVYLDLAKKSLYHLGMIEQDQEVLKRYSSYKENINVYENSYENKLTRTPLTPKEVQEVGSLVIIHEAGIAPYKTVKGKIKDDDLFQTLFKAALITAIATSGKKGVNESLLLYLVGDAYNPIPIYTKRKKKNVIVDIEVKVEKHPFPLIVLDDYSHTVIRNYNEKYPEYVRYNISSIVAKVLAVYAVSKVVEMQGDGNSNQSLFDFIGLMINVIGGNLIKASLQPDLRSWNLTYSNLQVRRIFLKPGKYTLEVDDHPFNYFSKIEEKVVIKPGKATFILLKSF